MQIVVSDAVGKHTDSEYYGPILEIKVAGNKRLLHSVWARIVCILSAFSVSPYRTAVGTLTKVYEDGNVGDYNVLMFSEKVVVRTRIVVQKEEVHSFLRYLVLMKRTYTWWTIEGVEFLK